MKAPITVREVNGYFQDLNSTNIYQLQESKDSSYHIGVLPADKESLTVMSDKSIKLKAKEDIVLDAPNIFVGDLVNAGNTQSLASIITKVTEHESSIKGLTEFKTGAETRFNSIEQTANADRSSINILSGRLDINETAIAGLQTEVTDTSIKSKLSAELTKLKNLGEATQTLSETINTVNLDGTALAGQLVSKISNFEYLPSTVSNPHWVEDGRDTSKVYYAKNQEDSKYYYYYYKNNQWLKTTDPATAGCTVTSAGIITSINAVGDSQTKINADKINLTGYATFESLKTPGATEIDGGNIVANTLKLQSSNIENFNSGVVTVLTDKAVQTETVLADYLKVNATNIKNLTAESIVVSGDGTSKNLSEYLAAEKNKTVSQTVIKYARNNNTKEHPNSLIAWFDNDPGLEYGTILWQQISKTYSNGSSDVTYVCLGLQDAFRLEITSNVPGTIYDVMTTEVTLTATLYQGTTDVTDKYMPEAFSWTKNTDLGTQISWVPSYPNSSKHNITKVSLQDIDKKATFNCVVDLGKIKS